MMPRTYEQALAVLAKWGEGTTYTFGHERAKRIHDIMAYAQGTFVDEAIAKDHQIAALVNELRDISVKYHDAQQLRERIADVIVPHLKQLKRANDIIKRLDQFTDSIVCYASTVSEYEGNRLAKDIGDYTKELKP